MRSWAGPRVEKIKEKRKEGRRGRVRWVGPREEKKKIEKKKERKKRKKKKIEIK